MWHCFPFHKQKSPLSLVFKSFYMSRYETNISFSGTLQFWRPLEIHPKLSSGFFNLKKKKKKKKNLNFRICQVPSDFLRLKLRKAEKEKKKKKKE